MVPFAKVIICLLIGLSAVNAKFLALRPLKAREVLSLLQQSGRTDAIPQGRVITQGLAAMTGFALGLTKGLGAAFIYDVITANVTDLDLNGDGGGGDGNANGNNNNNNDVKAQEICFSTRSLEDAETIAEAYSLDNANGNDKRRRVRPSAVKRRVKHKRRNKRKSNRRRKPARLEYKKHSLATATGIHSGTGTFTETTNPTVTVKDEEMPTLETTATETEAENDDDGLGTTSLTTSVSNDRAINCIVVENSAPS